MTLTFSPTTELDDISAELAKLDGGPESRVLAVKFPDGSYRVVGRITKDPDCTQEDFDFFLEQLARTYDR